MTVGGGAKVVVTGGCVVGLAAALFIGGSKFLLFLTGFLFVLN